MGKLIAPVGILLGAATWFLLFVILGLPLGTSFIAGGCAVGAGFLAAAMALGGPRIDATLSAAGLLLGIATFVILEVVLSVPLWVAVVSGLGAMGLYDIADAALRPGTTAAEPAPAAERRRPFAPPAWTRDAANGHAADRHEPIGAR
jgi:phosphate/sulfate permease